MPLMMITLFAHFRTSFFRRDLRHAAIARLSHEHCSPISKSTAFFRRDLRHAAIARLSHKHCSPILKHAFQETQALLPFLAFLTSADGIIVSDRVAFFRRDLRHAAIARLSHKHGSSIRRHSFQETPALFSKRHKPCCHFSLFSQVLMAAL
jgi:hypothetical protein